MSLDHIQLHKNQGEINAGQNAPLQQNVVSEQFRPQENLQRNRNSMEQRFDDILATDYYGVKEMDLSSYTQVLGRAPVLIHKPQYSVLENEFKSAFAVSLSDQKRLEKQRNKKSRLYKKLENDKLLKDSIRRVEDTSYYAMAELMPEGLKDRDMVTETALSKFMGASKEENQELVRLYIGENGNKSMQDRYKAMDHMLKILLGMPIDKLRLDNDEELAKNAVWLETFSQRVKAFDYLAQKHDYFSKIQREAGLTDLLTIQKKLTQFRSISRYYETRKEIIQNSFYKNRYNKELSMDITAANSDEEKELADLLLRSHYQHIEMLRQNEVPEKDIRKIKEPSFRSEYEARERIAEILKDTRFSKENLSKGNEEFEEGINKEVYKNVMRGAELRKKNEASKQLIKDKADTKEFKEELKKTAIDNVLIDYTPEYLKLDKDKRDPEYNEAELAQELAEFEKFDLRTLSFENHLDMLRDFNENRKIFEHVKEVHYKLFQGLNHGFKIDDEKLIYLRAKFMCAFELQEYMYAFNSSVAEGRLDLSMDQEKIRMEMERDVVEAEKRFKMHLPELGNPYDHMKKCLDYIREEYNNREQTIKDVYNTLEKGDDNASIPGTELRKKMAAYEKNAVVQDYLSRRQNWYQQEGPGKVISLYNMNKDDEEKIHKPKNERLNNTFLYGKSFEDQIRLTKYATGTPSERLMYCREAILDFRSVDLKEFDVRDIGKLYENLERKFTVLAIGTNMKDIAEIAMKAATELQKEELAKNPKMRVKLPEELKGLGYDSMDDMVKEMFVNQELVNALQGKFDSIMQTCTSGFLTCYSLEELNNLDAKTIEKWRKNYYEISEKDDLNEVETWVQAGFGYFTSYCISIDTRVPTTKQSIKGELAPNFTGTEDVLELYEEEKNAYFWKKTRDDRNSVTPSQLVDENKEATRLKNELVGIQTGKDKMIGGFGLKQEGINMRFIKHLIGPLSYIENDSLEKTRERTEAISIDLTKATNEQKTRYAKEVEDIYRLVMNFDLNRFNFDSMEEIAKGGVNDAIIMGMLCLELTNLSNSYLNLIDDEQVDTLFTREEFMEIRAKVEFMYEAQSFFDYVLNLQSDPLHAKQNLFYALRWSKEEIEERGSDEEDDDEAYEEYYKQHPEEKKFREFRGSHALVALSLLKDVAERTGIMPGVDMELLFNKKKVKMYKAPEKDQTKEIMKKLEKR